VRYSQIDNHNDIVPAKRLEELVRAVLPRHGKLLRRGTKGRDYSLEINGTPFIVRWVGDCGLRLAREIVTQKHGPSPLIIVAQRVSDGAREILSNSRIGWIDATGAAEIATGQLLVSKSGRSEPPPEKPAKWTPAVLSVAEVILCGTKATVNATAEATGLSVAACTLALKTLAEFGLLSSSTSRGPASSRRVEDPVKLLEAYALAANARRRAVSLTVGVTWQDLVKGISELGKQWDKSGVRWAATGAIAASVMAPYLTTFGSGEVYVDVETRSGLEALASQADLKPTPNGRITLLPFPTVASERLAKPEGRIRVAPWPRVYADLRRIGVRGEEAAEHLREVVLNAK
jgi:hypothetical protein